MPGEVGGVTRPGGLGPMPGPSASGAIARNYAAPNVKKNSGKIDIPVADIVANDQGTTKTISSVQNPSNCTATLNGANVEFTPTAEHKGSASFEYTLSCDEGTDDATVTVDVRAAVGHLTFGMRHLAPIGCQG